MRFLLQNRLTIIVPVPETIFFKPNPCFFRKVQAYFVSYSLTKTPVFDPRCGGVAQLGERCVRNAEVGSSILLLSTKELLRVSRCVKRSRLFLLCTNFSYLCELPVVVFLVSGETPEKENFC